MSGSQAREALDHVLALAGRGFDEAFTDGSSPRRSRTGGGALDRGRGRRVRDGPARGALPRHPGSVWDRCSG